MTKDSGSWLSAEQAVLPDGTERENLSLVRKKLPALSQVPSGHDSIAGDSADAQPVDTGGAADKS